MEKIRKRERDITFLQQGCDEDLWAVKKINHAKGISWDEVGEIKWDRGKGWFVLTLFAEVSLDAVMIGSIHTFINELTIIRKGNGDIREYFF